MSDDELLQNGYTRMTSGSIRTDVLKEEIAREIRNRKLKSKIKTKLTVLDNAEVLA
jgi:hypothetical protein